MTIGDLWLPIVLATVLCFLSGAVLHMMLPIHRADWVGLPDEEGVLAVLRRAGAGPGNYMFPYTADMRAMNDPGFVAKLEQGPCGVMTLRPPGRIRMAPYFTKQVLFHLAVSVVIAYLASRTISPGAAYLSVFRIVGTTAILGYTAAIFPAAIWYHEPRNYVTGKVVDGLVWGLLTAGSFAGFWPA